LTAAKYALSHGDKLRFHSLCRAILDEHPQSAEAHQAEQLLEEEGLAGVVPTAIERPIVSSMERSIRRRGMFYGTVLCLVGFLILSALAWYFLLPMIYRGLGYIWLLVTLAWVGASYWLGVTIARRELEAGTKE